MFKAIKLVLMLTILLVLGGVTTADAQEIFKVPEEDTNIFLNVSMSQLRIDNMTKAEYEMLMEIDGEIVSAETKYFEVSQMLLKKNNFKNNEISALGIDDLISTVLEIDEETYLKKASEKINDDIYTIADSYSPGEATNGLFMVSTFLSKRPNTTFRIHTSTIWSRSPFNRGYDVIGTTINPSFWSVIKGTETGKQTWTENVACGTSSNKEIVYGPGNRAWTPDLSGYALTLALPGNYYPGTPCYGTQVVNLVSFVAFEVERLAPTNKLEAWGSYSHQTSGILVTPSISFTGASFSVSPTKNYDNAKNHAVYSW